MPFRIPSARRVPRDPQATAAAVPMLAAGAIRHSKAVSIGSALFNAVHEAVASRAGAARPPGASGSMVPVGQRLANMRLLIVDDSKINLMIAQRTLEREGAHITLASDGREAFEV